MQKESFKVMDTTNQQLIGGGSMEEKQTSGTHIQVYC